MQLGHLRPYQFHLMSRQHKILDLNLGALHHTSSPSYLYFFKHFYSGIILDLQKYSKDNTGSSCIPFTWPLSILTSYITWCIYQNQEISIGITLLSQYNFTWILPAFSLTIFFCSRIDLLFHCGLRNDDFLILTFLLLYLLEFYKY